MVITIKKLIEYRRHLHKYPEIGFNTKNTINYIVKIINSISYNQEKIKLNICEVENSLIVTLKTKESTILGFRADIDALEIVEKNDVIYKSINSYMHACGHDAHTAIALRVIIHILENPNLLNGTIRFIFQNAEEGPNEGGAYHLINNPLIKEIESIFALHVNSELEPFCIYYKKNSIMAASNTFKIELFGKSAHVARFNEGIDVLDVGMRIYKKLKEISIDGLLYVGKFESGKATNIVPSYTLIEGTIRTFETREFNRIKEIIYKILKEESTYNEFSISYNNGYPSIINNSELVNLLIKSSTNKNIKICKLENAYLLSDDFSRYQINSNICYFFIGTKKNQPLVLHSDIFDINEDSLVVGYKILLELIKNYNFKYA